MNLVIFGATGTIGKILTEQALAENHQVTAFARHPERLDICHPNLTRHTGNVLDARQVMEAMTGQDAVIIALGAGAKGNVRSTGTEHVIQAMQQNGVERLICLSTLGVGDSAQFLNFFWKYIMFGWLLKAAFRDHEQQETIVRNSGLNWTIVRPAAYTDQPHSQHFYQGSLADAAKLRLKIPRVDVASFLLAQISDKSYVHQSPALSC